jgi:protein O-GlcNAc transferase
MPKHAIAWHNKGIIFQKLNRYVEALECYENSIDIDSNFVLPYNNKAWVLATIGINSEALTVINKALKMEPTDPRSMDTQVQYFTT